MSSGDTSEEGNKAGTSSKEQAKAVDKAAEKAIASKAGGKK